jgi:hypothetical protein
MRWMCLVVCGVIAIAEPTAAQEVRRGFAGGIVGVSTLSADGRSVTSAPDATISLYKPENGIAVNVFGGVHLSGFFSVQANYMWNRNDVTLVSSFLGPQGSGFYEQRRGSSQHVFVADTLLYFRRLGSAIRPYLGTGLAFVRFGSNEVRNAVSSNLDPPTGHITSTEIGIRSHVGIDLALSPRVSFRYSFSETISGNPISPHLMPEGKRGLANFQNLFGFVTHF